MPRDAVHRGKRQTTRMIIVQDDDENKSTMLVQLGVHARRHECFSVCLRRCVHALACKQSVGHAHIVCHTRLPFQSNHVRRPQHKPANTDVATCTYTYGYIYVYIYIYTDQVSNEN